MPLFATPLNRRKLLKPIAFLLCALPFIALVGQAVSGSFSANPIEDITHQTGEWALRLLLLTLAVTPVRRFFGWTWAAPLRRMLGLFAFFYASLHFFTWLLLDHGLLPGQDAEWGLIIEDIVDRPFITVGFAALVLLVPLAITSTNDMVKRVGAKNWKRLHKLVYPIGILAVLHFVWLVKADLLEPLIYAALLALLLLARLPIGKTRLSR